MSINTRFRGREADQEDIVPPSEHHPDDNVIIATGSTRNSHQPMDKYYFNYIVFYLLGMTTLLPWNFFVTAEDVS